MTSYWDAIIEDNKQLEEWGMPYRYGADGIAVCKDCGRTWFASERKYAACEHYDSFHEDKPL